MNHRHNPLAWAFDAGNWLGVRVRISVYFPLVMFVLCLKLGWQLGGVISAVLFLSVSLHELGHILSHRSVGGGDHDVVLWPFGGLTWSDNQLPLRSQLLVSGSGPLVNLVICLLTFSEVVFPAPEWPAFNPLLTDIEQLAAGLAGGETTRNMMSQVMAIVFAINWMLLLVNLLPARPLDGGRALHGWLAARIGPVMAGEVAPRFAFLASVVLIVVALVGNHVTLMLLAFVLILINLQESRPPMRRELISEESFMGYDFSEGYTSLERSAPADEEPSETSGGLFQRLHQKGEAGDGTRSPTLNQVEEAAVDKILAKLHEHGMQSLTEAEKRLLKQASARYREKGRG
jgi:Zn-dependent protease